MQSIYDFFGLQEDPFRLSPDPGFFYPSAVHKEALFSLEYVVKQREGFCVVTGEPGTGKSTIINVFKDRLRGAANIAVILTPRLSPDEFFQAVFDDFAIGIDRSNKNEMLKAFKEFLIKAYLENTYVIIVVDEAQNVPEDTLEELRLLSNLETDKDKLLQIILIGQPELQSRLNQPGLRQLNQRITERVMLRPLTLDETVEYINFRLLQAGRKQPALTRDLVRPVHRFSKGIPRIINLVLSRSIMAAYIDTSASITARHIDYALRHVHRKAGRRTPWRRPAARALTAGICILAAAVCGYALLLPGRGPVATDRGLPAAAGPLPADAQSQEPAPHNAETHAAEQSPGQVPHAAASVRLVVAPPVARVRAAPRPDAEIVGFAYQGMNIEATEAAQDDRGVVWYRIMDSPTGGGWISSDVAGMMH